MSEFPHFTLLIVPQMVLGDQLFGHRRSGRGGGGGGGGTALGTYGVTGHLALQQRSKVSQFVARSCMHNDRLIIYARLAVIPQIYGYSRASGPFTTPYSPALAVDHRPTGRPLLNTIAIDQRQVHHDSLCLPQ